MPSPFIPPDLDTDFSGTGYRAKLESNAEKTEQAFIDIANTLPSIQGTSIGAANLSAIERVLRPEGVLGHDSFFPTFGTDQDRIVVEHRQEGGVSSCVIANLYHQTEEAFEKLFSTIITSDGTYAVVFGVKSKGYPNLEMKILVEDTDQDVDLVLYRFDVTRSGSAWAVTNLRRSATVLVDRGAFTHVYEEDVPLVFALKGSIGTGIGPRECGVVAPWDLKVTGAFLRLGTAPTQTDGLEIEIRRGSGTDSQSVLGGAALWTIGQDGIVKELLALSPPDQVLAGEWIYADVTVPEVVAVAADLSITLLVRRLTHAIYR